ncbi:uncharacterized protein F5891DRAFT_1196554 [Suillus fuscotomentosus]|uniref:Fungal-type protein kinase domain-containing protein n=1 Tax=Suillus fuscotomentosus TaxID=1912939 RepID=A0AAD4HE76_9AGAM|nr:uncharacterized protein F5891DRAFT_1196554 [Suillus fuscotomentosus]KAG1893323.1 hypothetical protein F5891DRAFT_1196554 [Suillus fuscotomentosus]
MDKLTDLELSHLILEENHLDHKDELGHLLSLIFRSYTDHVPRAEELTVPLKKIPINSRTNTFLDIEDEETTVPLYNGQTRRWNWALPTSYKSASHAGSGVGGSKGGMNREPGDWVLVADNRTEADLSESQPESTTDQTKSDLPVKDDPMLSVTDVSGDSGDSGDPWETSPDGYKEALASASSDSETSREIEPQQSTTEAIFGSFFNTSAANSSRPVRGEEIARKPDLTLLDNLEARWDTIKAVCELTASPYLPSQTLSKTLDSKAYLLLKHQPWRRFALFISLCNGYHDLRVHLYDHSGGVELDKYLHIFSCIVFGNLECIGFDPTITILKHTLHRTLELSGSRPTKNLPSKRQEVVESSQLEENELSLPPAIAKDMVPTPAAGDTPMYPPIVEVPEDPLNPEPVLEPIGKIRVDKNTYDILEIIFSTQGLVGRGSVCYLARKDDKEYIIKDHWVLGGKKAVLNEINMMKKMEGVCGVPQLAEYWLVEVAPSEVDDTQAYCYKFPHSIQDTFPTHVRLVLKPRVRPLHKFRSKVEFLGAIRDIVNIQRKAVEKRKVLHRDASLNNAMIEDDGDGSHRMLIDWEFAVDIVEGEQYVVGGTGTLPFMSRSLLFNLYLHTPDTSDERSGKCASGSRPYPVALIKHNYKDDLESIFTYLSGPVSKNLNWITREWSGTYEQCSASKTRFFHHSDHYTAQLTKQFDPYFWDLLPLALEWYNLIKDPASVCFENIIAMLEKHLANLLRNELSPGLLVSTWMLQGLSASASSLSTDEEDTPSVDEMSKKRVIEHRWTTDLILPKPKRSKIG